MSLGSVRHGPWSNATDEGTALITRRSRIRIGHAAGRAVGGVPAGSTNRRGSEFEQIARGADRERWRVEAGVVEQVAVTRDDRPGTGGERERDEVVVSRIAENARWLARIAQLDARARDLAHGALGVGRVDALEEVGLCQAASDLTQESRADDRLEVPSKSASTNRAGGLGSVPTMPDSSALASMTSRVTPRAGRHERL